MMSAVEVVREWKRRNRAGDLAALAQGVDLDRYTEQCLGLTGWTTGYDIARANYVRNLIEPWADVVTSEEEVVEGPASRSGEGMTFEGRHVSVADTVVIRARTEATHVEEFRGIAPTGRRIWWDSVTLAWVKDGRVVGQWAAPDLCWFIRTSRISGIGVSRLKPAIEARV